MKVDPLEVALEALDKANTDLEPELMTVAQARVRLETYARVRRRVDYGVAALARRVEDASEVASITGTSMGRAKETVATGKVMDSSGELGEALKFGEVSLEQATEIARAEASAPGCARELVAVAKDESFHALRDKALRTKLEIEQHRDLRPRQRAARCARSHRDALGMINIHLSLEPKSGLRSSTAPRPQQPGWRASPRKRGRSSRSSATPPTPMRRCCPAPARAGPGVPSWS